MLVYGERCRELDTLPFIQQIIATAEWAALLPRGIARHAALVGLLIEIGELEQGLNDAFDAQGGLTARGQSSGHNLRPALLGAARAVLYSCEELGLLAGSRRLPRGWLRRLIAELKAYAAHPARPARITVKPLEGFAYYSLYPELYIQAALQYLAADAAQNVRVVGILSIGATLAAVVMATLRAAKRNAEGYSLRPSGHPFSRVLDLADLTDADFPLPPTQFNDLYARFGDINGVGRIAYDQLLAARPIWRIGGEAARQIPHLIVDEGPGLSGSSFGAVADWLEGQGLARDRLTFFPSHANPLGPHARAEHGERWGAARKYVADFEEVFIASGWLAELVSDLTDGVGELEEVGYGRWRAKLLGKADWPAVHVQQERRKYLCTVGGKCWLLKFAGLGHYGADKLPLAHSLAEAGFIPPVVGLRHGFMVSAWQARAQPLVGATLRQIDRTALVDFVADYLAHRARHFPAAPSDGASVEQLYAMMTYNTEQALDEEAALMLGEWQGRQGELVAAERRVLTDNKMQSWEWLLLPDGRLHKSDALDHHAAHDLIGAQDIGWDIAAAALELALDRDETARLLARFAHKAGYRPTPTQLAFYRAAYIAFQVGHYTLAMRAMSNDADEHNRLRDAASAWTWRLDVECRK